MACYYFKLPDGSRGFVCGARTARPALCSMPGCKALHTKLCDAPRPRGGTCDRKLCDRHATSAGPDRDYCPAHAQQPELGL